MGEMFTKFWSENMKGGDFLNDQNADGRITLNKDVEFLE
jgi:hypothetical protein